MAGSSSSRTECSGVCARGGRWGGGAAKCSREQAAQNKKSRMWVIPGAPRRREWITQPAPKGAARHLSSLSVLGALARRAHRQSRRSHQIKARAEEKTAAGRVSSARRLHSLVRPPARIFSSSPACCLPRTYSLLKVCCCWEKRRRPHCVPAALTPSHESLETKTARRRRRRRRCTLFVSAAGALF